MRLRIVSDGKKTYITDELGNEIEGVTIADVRFTAKGADVSLTFGVMHLDVVAKLSEVLVEERKQENVA